MHFSLSITFIRLRIFISFGKQQILVGLETHVAATLFFFHNYKNILAREIGKQGNTKVMQNLVRRSPSGTTLSILEVSDRGRGLEAIAGSIFRVDF